MSILAQMVFGAGGPRVQVTNQSASDTTATPFNPTASYTLANNGQVQTNAGVPENWIRPTSAAGNAYEARATVTSGSLTSGTTGTWLALGTSRQWTLSTIFVGTVSCVFTIEIRNATSLTILSTATITLTATKTL